MSRDRVGCLFIFISLRLSIAPFKLVLFETTGDPRGKAAGGTIPRFGASEAQIPRVKRPHNDSPPTSQLHFAAHGASAQSAVQLDSDYSAAVVAHQFFPTPVLFGLAIFYDLSPLHLYKRSLGQGSFDYEVPSFEALHASRRAGTSSMPAASTSTPIEYGCSSRGHEAIGQTLSQR
ncbi:hypothetical protein R3P38DRAFT_3351586 [Favolaschia claudopus]|uniref:Uncharacterized protein n=1 Tax=Favolaschia claudopus TaxID=2862362 RepID=A0AAW0C5U3_9AGAR